MDIVSAIVLGLVEGLTEYLPISSTAHLLLAEKILAVDQGDASKAYAIVIQGGAILAVLILYFDRVREVLLGLIGKSERGMQLAIHICLAFLPSAVVGILLEKYIKSYLFTLPFIAIAWFVGGGVILIVARARLFSANKKSLDGISWKSALFIGSMQCLAMFPGVSRSLVTILGGMCAGLKLRDSAEFSFLLGCVTLSAACGYDLYKTGSLIMSQFGLVSPLIGFLVATLSAMIAVKWMVGFLESHGLSLFGWYRIVAGIILGVTLAFEII